MQERGGERVERGEVREERDGEREERGEESEERGGGLKACKGRG